jgi:hypothetical protein
MWISKDRLRRIEYRLTELERNNGIHISHPEFGYEYGESYSLKEALQYLYDYFKLGIEKKPQVNIVKKIVLKK